MVMAQLPAYLKSIGGGALGGATLGSTLGPLGAAGGGLAGGALGALLQYLSPENNNQQVTTIGGQGNPITGYNASAQQFPRFTPEQQQAQSQFLQRGLANSNFQGIEDYARKQFNQKTIPSLANRFSAFGHNDISSPDFANQLGEHATDLETNLASLRAGHGFNEAQLGLQPTFENIYTPAQQGVINNPQNSSVLIQLLSQLLSNLRG